MFHDDLGVSKNRATPKWMVKIMKNPIKIDDLGGKPIIFGNIHLHPPRKKDGWESFPIQSPPSDFLDLSLITLQQPKHPNLGFRWFWMRVWKPGDFFIGENVGACLELEFFKFQLIDENPWLNSEKIRD